MSTVVKVKDAQERRRLMNRFYQLTHVSIPFDGLVSCITGKLEIDILALDKKLSSRDADYNSEECTFKGEPCSLSGYLEQRWGKEASDIIAALI